MGSDGFSVDDPGRLTRFQLAQTRYTTPSGDDPQRLREVAAEFETLFVKQVVDSMRATLNPDNHLVDTGMAGEIFQDMLYDEYSATLAKTGGFGLADLIVNRYET